MLVDRCVVLVPRTCYGHWLGSPSYFGRDDDESLLARSTRRRGHPRITRSAGCLTRHSPPSCSSSQASLLLPVFRSGFVLERSIHPWLACSRKHAYAIDRCEIERLTRPLSCMSALVTNCRGGAAKRELHRHKGNPASMPFSASWYAN